MIMPDFCAAVGCSNERTAETKQQGITFHRFPKDQVKRKAWAAALRRRDFEPKDCSVVCSCHFKSEDFDRTGQTTRLKEGVVPSIIIFPDHLCKVPSGTFRLSRTPQKSAADNPDSLDQPSEELEESTPDHKYALEPVKEMTTKLTEAQEKVLELQRDLRTSMDRERRHRKTVKSLLQDLKHKDLLTEELQQKFDFYSGRPTYKPGVRKIKTERMASLATKLHITVQQHGVLPPLQKCVQCCNKYHCPFCTPDTFKPTKHSACINHLLSHKKRAVHHQGYDIYKCHLPCVPNSHFHCVYCTLTYSRRDGIITHLTKCHGEQSLDVSVLDEPMNEPSLDNPSLDEQALDESRDKTCLDEPVWNEPIDESALDETEFDESVDESMDKPSLDEPVDEPALDKPVDKPPSEEPTSKVKVSQVRRSKVKSVCCPQRRLTLHITVQQHGVLPPLQKCVQCCNKYHCPFCTPDTFKPTKHSACINHLLSHKKRAVHHQGYDIYKCHLPCAPNSHFHCVYCTLTYSRRDGIITHLTKCQGEQSLDEPVLDEPMNEPSLDKPSLDEQALDKSMDKTCLDQPVWNEPIDESALDETEFDESVDESMDKPSSDEPVDEPALDKSVDKPPSEEPTSKVKVSQVGSSKVKSVCCPQRRLTLHITVQQHGVLPPLQKCVQCCNKYHCPFCTPDTFKPTKHSACINHLLSHKKRAVHHQGYDIYKCHLPCVPNAHFHCVYCTLTYSRRDGIINHLTKCQGEHSLDMPVLDETMNEPSLDEQALDKSTYEPSLNESVDEPELDEPVDKPPSEEPTSKAKVSQVGSSKVKSVCCPQCSLTMRAKNLKKHLQRKHSQNKVMAIAPTSCKRSEPMDDTEPDILKRARWTEPVLHTEGVVSTDCDGWKTFHPPNGETDLDEPDDEPMDEPVWHEPAWDESVDKLSSEETASKEKVSQVRAKVKSVRCPQCGLTMNAKNVKKHLQRKHSKSDIMDITPTSHKRSEALDSTDLDIFKRVRWTEAALHTDNVVTTALAAAIYPPKGDLMKRMVEYTFNRKKLPATLPEEVRRVTHYPKSLIPPEKLCSVCPGAGPLTDPILITSNARIVTADGIIEDISTYCKMCCKCGMFYRYQQFEDGLHNFNDSILLGLHFCLFLRAHLQNNQSIGSLLQTLEYLTKMQFPSAESISHAYLHFEALSNHDYSYNCVRCGDHPPVVIMDLHKKGVFNMSETDLKAPPESYKGEVHIEDFWDSVTKHIIARGFLISNEENPFKVPPSFESWAPWIGPKTRRSSVVLNTEFHKLHAAPDKEPQLHVTENHLVDELVNQEVEVARMLCKECGLDTAGSILDLVLRLKDGMRSRATYNKVFEKIWGASGGWAALLCPCGIVYSVKVLLKGESPQDFADLLLSWQHIPNVCVYDFARDLARHTNWRQPERMPFSPHEGQLLHPTPEIIRDAKEGRIHVNLPWLSERKNPPDVDCHPCTGSSERYVLSNGFHDRESDPKDVLRRVSLVPQLAQLLNTRVVEQFFDHMREADYFLSDTASETYMFLLRNVLHHRNMRLNKETAALISQHALEEQQPSAASQTSLTCSYRLITL